jgi:hypothetical protein
MRGTPKACAKKLEVDVISFAMLWECDPCSHGCHGIDRY